MHKRSDVTLVAWGNTIENLSRRSQKLRMKRVEVIDCGQSYRGDKAAFENQWRRLAG